MFVDSCFVSLSLADDFQGNLRGLGALLFDDGMHPTSHGLSCNLTPTSLEPPPSQVQEENVIQKTLNAIGVTYSHRNDEVLVPSRIEEERTRNTLRVRCFKNLEECYSRSI
jgi:hypothetical protein